jgi:hypothetical protein
MSFLSSIGKDFKAVFSFLGSTKGQADVTAVEGVVETGATLAGVGAPVTAGINLINKWLTEIVKAETLAAAAEQQTGSGATKAAAVISVITPQVLAAFPGTTSTAIAEINTSLVAALNQLGSTAVPATPAAG